MPSNDAQEMQSKKRRRVMDVPDGFQVDSVKVAVQVPKFTSTFEGKLPKVAEKKPISKTKFDPRSDFVLPKPVAAPLNKPRSKTNLKQLAVPVFPSLATEKEKEKQKLSVSRLQTLPNLSLAETSTVITPHLLRRRPPPPVLSSKPAPVLKNLPAPTTFASAEMTIDPSLRTISTTEIALATDLFTDSGTAELAHIFLQDQHPEIAVPNRQWDYEWNIGMSPMKHSSGKGKEAKYIKGGLASRASELIAQSCTSLSLWQKEIELLLASSQCQLKADLRLRIVKIIDVPAGAKFSSPHKHKSSLAANSGTSTGLAVCRVVSTPQPRRHIGVISRIREKQYHFVILTFPIIAPPRLRGHSGLYIRNPEDFIVGREICVWEPWDEVLLTPASLDGTTSLDAEFHGAELRPAPFPMLPPTYPLPPSLPPDEEVIQTVDTAILCSRFVITP
ncbi:hypothetical protein H0H87_012822 [Tephrocybe sp. NHM501043]|nr:hypothetical protein H0H87_012822 [Tephrocybe sp. NHM501043]